MREPRPTAAQRAMERFAACMNSNGYTLSGDTAAQCSQIIQAAQCRHDILEAATSLQALLRDQGLDVQRNPVLEAIARYRGKRNWDELSASPDSPQAQSQAQSQPHVLVADDPNAPAEPAFAEQAFPELVAYQRGLEPCVDILLDTYGDNTCLHSAAGYSWMQCCIDLERLDARLDLNDSMVQMLNRR